MCTDIQFLTNRLLASLNNNYEVVDMSSVLLVISQLESALVTKEQLETTLLVKYINLLRKSTRHELLARRAKNLLKKWRNMILPPNTISRQSHSASQMPPENNFIERHSHTPQLSFSQPTSPAVQPDSDKMMLDVERFSQPLSTENKSLPGYPCSTSANSTKNYSNPTSKKSTQDFVSNGTVYHSQEYLEQSSEPKVPYVREANTRSNKDIYGNQNSKKQPTSFANLIESQLHTSGEVRGDAGPSFPGEENRSQSPVSLSRKSRIRQDRSMLVMDNSVSPVNLDQSSQPSREGAVAPLSKNKGSDSLTAVNNNTISSCSRLQNGEYSPEAIELQDSDSTVNLTVPIDVCKEELRSGGNRSSEHRKNKKHKKEKKRHRQEKVQENSSIATPDSTVKAAGNAVPPLSDDAQIFEASLFPMQDNLSLSNSSLSMFPNATTANNNRPGTPRGKDPAGTVSSDDLSFAGRFKKFSFGNEAEISHQPNQTVGISGYCRSDDLSYAVAGESGDCHETELPRKMAKLTDGRAVVLIESRSCSPFTSIGRNFNDCSNSSSHTYTRELIEVANHESQFSEDVQMQPIPLPQQPLLKPVEVGLVPSEESKVPKKRGRKKGSRGADAMMAQFNSQLFENSKLLSLSSLSGSKKVKTTKELLADIQSRKLESTTSSPTIPSQSRPPSVSSETFLNSPSTSDACSTNATMSTVARSTPEQNIVSASNFQVSGVDDDSISNSTAPPSIPRKEAAEFEEDAKPLNKVETKTSIEDEIRTLMKMLPPVNPDVLNWEPDEVVCTCTVHEVDPVQVEVVPKEDVPEPKPVPKVEVVFAPVVPVRKISSPVKVQLPDKPVKSIFDLDYDEENDPLRNFLEEAKTCKDDSHPEKEKMKTEGAKKHPEESAPIISVTLPSQDQENEQLYIQSPSEEEPMIVFNTNLSSVLVEPQIPQQNLPQFEVIEDPNCKAKLHFEDQKKRITNFHINALHNCYIPNVNGNWSVANSDTSEEPKSHMPEDGLYERVVPQYSFLVSDAIPKDLSHVKFTARNKIKRLKMERRQERRKLSMSVVEEVKQSEVASSPPIEPDSTMENETENLINNMSLSNCTENVSCSSDKVTISEEPSSDHKNCTVEDADERFSRKEAESDEPKIVSSKDKSVLLIDETECFPQIIVEISNNNSNHNSRTRRSSSCSNSSVILNAISYSNNVITSKDDENHTIINCIDDRDEVSNGLSNCSEDQETDNVLEDDEEEYDDDEDEEEDGNGDFHEVITHDMTSSTSTVGNKLVLTIKKTPSKVTPQSSPLLVIRSTGDETIKWKLSEDAEYKEYVDESKDANCDGDSNDQEMAVDFVKPDEYVEDLGVAELDSKDNTNSCPGPPVECCEITVQSVEGKENGEVYGSSSMNDDTPAPNCDVQQIDNEKSFPSPGDVTYCDITSKKALSRSSSESNVSQLSAEETENPLEDDNNQMLPSFNDLNTENRTGSRETSKTDLKQQFREWHEVLQVPSYNDELLTILPYVVID